MCREEKFSNTRTKSKLSPQLRVRQESNPDHFAVSKGLVTQSSRCQRACHTIFISHRRLHDEPKEHLCRRLQYITVFFCLFLFGIMLQKIVV